MLAPSIHNLELGDKDIENQARLKQINLNFILNTHMASINANSLEQMKVFIYEKVQLTQEHQHRCHVIVFEHQYMA